MSKKVLQTYLPLLQFITNHRIKPECFISLIKSFDDKTTKFICACIRNLTSKQYIETLDLKSKRKYMKKIIPHKQFLKTLSKRCKSYKLRKQMIVQKGYGILFPILSSIIPLITSLLSK